MPVSVVYGSGARAQGGGGGGGGRGLQDWSGLGNGLGMGMANFGRAIEEGLRLRAERAERAQERKETFAFQKQMTEFAENRADAREDRRIKAELEQLGAAQREARNTGRMEHYLRTLESSKLRRSELAIARATGASNVLGELSSQWLQMEAQKQGLGAQLFTQMLATERGYTETQAQAVQAKVNRLIAQKDAVMNQLLPQNVRDTFLKKRDDLSGRLLEADADTIAEEVYRDVESGTQQIMQLAGNDPDIQPFAKALVGDVIRQLRTTGSSGGFGRLPGNWWFRDDRTLSQVVTDFGKRLGDYAGQKFGVSDTDGMDLDTRQVEYIQNKARTMRESGDKRVMEAGDKILGFVGKLADMSKSQSLALSTATTKLQMNSEIYGSAQGEEDEYSRDIQQKLAVSTAMDDVSQRKGILDKATGLLQNSVKVIQASQKPPAPGRPEAAVENYISGLKKSVVPSGGSLFTQGTSPASPTTRPAATVQAPVPTTRPAAPSPVEAIGAGLGLEDQTLPADFWSFRGLAGE